MAIMSLSTGFSSTSRTSTPLRAAAIAAATPAAPAPTTTTATWRSTAGALSATERGSISRITASPPVAISTGRSRISSRPARASPGGVSAKRLRASAERSAKRQRPWMTSSLRALPTAGERPKPTLDMVASTTLSGEARRSMTGSPSGVFSTTPPQDRITRRWAAPGKSSASRRARFRTSGRVGMIGRRHVGHVDPLVRPAAVHEIAPQGLPAVEAIARHAAVPHEREEAPWRSSRRGQARAAARCRACPRRVPSAGPPRRSRCQRRTSPGWSRRR